MNIGLEPAEEDSSPAVNPLTIAYTTLRRDAGPVPSRPLT